MPDLSVSTSPTPFSSRQAPHIRKRAPLLRAYPDRVTRGSTQCPAISETAVGVLLRFYRIRTKNSNPSKRIRTPWRRDGDMSSAGKSCRSLGAQKTGAGAKYGTGTNDRTGRSGNSTPARKEAPARCRVAAQGRLSTAPRKIGSIGAFSP